VHRDLYHAGSLNHNFGFYFSWWSQWMGTEHPDYSQVYREVAAATFAGSPVNNGEPSPAG
jgi:sterol desaturase/sphingolipid hydroxylase (fatty acid hydroxylase superfamily)